MNVRLFCLIFNICFYSVYSQKAKTKDQQPKEKKPKIKDFILFEDNEHKILYRE